MPDPTIAVIAAWVPFYSFAGTAAATLSGLMFVTVSLHVEALARQDGAVLRNLATQAMLNFVNVIMLALVMLIPNLGANTLSIALISIGALGWIRAGLRMRTIMGLKREAINVEHQALINTPLLVSLPLILCYALIVVIGILIRRDVDFAVGGLYCMVIVIGYLLGTATMTAWRTLLQLATACNIDANPT
jgi:hypothetical protein